MEFLLILYLAAVGPFGDIGIEQTPIARYETLSGCEEAGRFWAFNKRGWVWLPDDVDELRAFECFPVPSGSGPGVYSRPSAREFFRRR